MVTTDIGWERIQITETTSVGASKVRRGCMNDYESILRNRTWITTIPISSSVEHSGGKDGSCRTGRRGDNGKTKLMHTVMQLLGPAPDREP